MTDAHATVLAARGDVARRVLALLDLTSLGEDDTPQRIEALCASACTPWGDVAAVCVHPEHVTTARRCLRRTSVTVATVVNFPDGGSDPARVGRETRRAIGAGAEEIDLVLPYRALLRGEAAFARDVIGASRAACGPGIVLKLILETGALATPAAIQAACALGIQSGADFLKTSTGRTATGATREASAVILDTIAAAGGRCGFKAAGGVRTLDQAQDYVALAAERLGDGWVVPAHFRIGASALLDEIGAVLSAADATA